MAWSSVRTQLLAVGLTLALLLSGTRALAQGESAGMQRASRAQLAARVADIERQLAGNARGADRTRLTSEVAAIKQRLAEGDFGVGNQFVVTIVTPETSQPDTVSVRDSLVISFPPIVQPGLPNITLPDASVRGVLRSEIDEAISTHVARYLRNATVRVNVLTRLIIAGAVARQGSFLASPDRPISEVLMLAGGPTPEGKLDEVEITRAGTKILSAKDSRKVLKEGKTLAQVDVQSGDVVTVPKKKKINWTQVIQVAALVTTLIFAVLQFVQYYYNSKEN